MQDKNNLKILFVSAEVSPFAKTGGLADVAGSLPQSLAVMGNDVRIVMPRYKSISAGMSYVADFPVRVGDRKEACIVRETEILARNEMEDSRVPVYFIDSYHYFDRDGIYCFLDDADRYAFFCNAVLEMLPKINFQPDIIHCNDWHTGPICMLLNEKYRNIAFYNKISTVYTIHNLEYQGNFSSDAFRLFNLPQEIFVSEKAEFYGMFSFTKVGLVYADVINAVSETYAKEIQTEQYGEKMEGLLKGRTSDLYGIVNGISYDDFNPSTDTRIFKNYNIDTFLDKKQNKTALQKEMNLPVRDVPVFGLISRLTGQKGLNLIMDQIDGMMKQDLQFILLGSGDEYYEGAFKKVRENYPDKMGVYIGFNASLAQRIYAGSDFFLMPSRFEPCGLGQIISFRYGTVPLVRATGGLVDTVLDIESDSENGNGFSFKDFSSEEFFITVKRALKFYNEQPEQWKQLVKRTLSLDYSWNKSAKKYMGLYNRALRKH